MKHTFSLLLSVLLLTMTACSDSGKTAAETPKAAETVPNTAEETAAEPSYIDTLGEKDFGGAEYVVIVPHQIPDLMHPAVTEMTGEPVNDAFFQRDLAIQDRYNITIRYPEYDNTNAHTAIVKSVLAGDTISDIYIGPLCEGGSQMGYAFQRGALHNLKDVPYLQLDQKWWSSLMYEKLSYNGKIFFTSGDMAGYTFMAPSCVFMNLKVAADNDIDAGTVYQLVFDNKWTLDELGTRAEGLHKDVNGDGKITPDADSYGVINATINLTCEELLVGAGMEMSGIDENGELTVDLNSERILGIIEKVRKYFCETNASDDLDLLLKNSFCEDRTLFAVHFVSSSINKYRDMKSDYVILPMPKYDEAQKSYMSYVNPFCHCFIAVPLVQDDLEKTGFITEVMEYMTVESVRPMIYDVTLKEKIARNTDTQAVLDIIYNTTYTDFNAIFNFGGTIDLLDKAVFQNKDYASGYAKIEEKAAKAIDKITALFTDSKG